MRSPLSDAILGEQALAVTDDKVSVLELQVQPVMGISLSLSRGAAHPGEVTATCRAQSALPAPKQVMAVGQGDKVESSCGGSRQSGWAAGVLVPGPSHGHQLLWEGVSSPQQEVAKQLAAVWRWEVA